MCVGGREERGVSALFWPSEFCRDSEQLEKSLAGSCFALSIPLSHYSIHRQL